MRISGMQATCRAMFCQINSSPRRKRHWVGCTWPVSMYASGLCVAAAPSRRWEWNTLSLSPAVEWRNLSHIFSLDYSLARQKKPFCNICVKSAVWKRELNWLCTMQSIFITAPTSAGKLQSDALVRYKTLSYCSKNHFVQMNIFYWPIYYIQWSKDKVKALNAWKVISALNLCTFAVFLISHHSLYCQKYFRWCYITGEIISG